MGPGRDRTRDPWISSQTRICCQTRYRLRYAANCLFPIETHITCDFPGGSGPPVPPLDPHLNDVCLGRLLHMSLDLFDTIID